MYFCCLQYKGDSNEYTQYIIFSLKKLKITLNCSKSAGMVFSMGLKNEFETATYFRFSFRCFKRGRCQLLAKVCARSTR